MTGPAPRRKPVLALLMRLLGAAALVLPAFGTSGGGVLTTLHSFLGGNDGADPFAGLVQGSDGSLYGTTLDGGTNISGTVFKISTNGAYTSLYSFVGGNDGAWPNGLVQGSDGYFYGTTQFGGTNNSGTVFKISTNGALTSLYSFTGGDGGKRPRAGLMLGSDGYFYGTTVGVPDIGPGTVFKISTNWALTTLHVFTNIYGQGLGGLLQGQDGNIYGATSAGGGSVFRISTNGAYTSVYSFAGGDDGAYPSGLVQGRDGNLYGTASGGGMAGNGTVFELSSNGALTSVYSFTGGNDGAYPGGLVQGRDGNLYGTTEGGSAGPSVWGTVFKIGTNALPTTLYSFRGGPAHASLVGLVQGSDGDLYGTTFGDGLRGAGTVFRLTVVESPAPVFQAVTHANGAVTLVWKTQAAATYQVQYSSDLSSTNWTNLGSALTAGGATLGAADPIGNSPRRFYRLLLLP